MSVASARTRRELPRFDVRDVFDGAGNLVPEALPEILTTDRSQG